MSSIDVDYNQDLSALAGLLSSVKRPGSFFTSGSIGASLPRLEIEGVGTIAFPVLDPQARAIVTAAERAPYGRGEATLVDTRVRKVWQIAGDKIRLGGNGWKKTLDSVVALCVKGLGCQSATVSATLYKLLLYDEGSFFVSHRDTEKVAGMFATLVVVLPSLHEGGQVVVRHDDREVTLDLRVDSDDVLSRLSYAAFYADCEHEVRPITQGNRLCLVYNLVQKHPRKGTGRAPPQAPDYRPETAGATKLLETWAKRQNTPPKIAYLLEHQYSPTGLSFSALKNGDAAFSGVLLEAATRAGYAVHLGIVHIEESGSADVYHSPNRPRWSPWGSYDEEEGDDDDCEPANDDDFEIIEAYDSFKSIDNWVDTRDRPVEYGQIPLGKGELLPAGSLDNEKPDMQRVREATGNEGGSYERAYHRAAIVLWQKSRYAEVLLQAGADAAIPYLKELVESWAAGDSPTRTSEVWREIERLTKGLIQKWAVERGHYRRRTGDLSQNRRDVLAILRAAGNAALLRQFVEKIVVREFDGGEQDELVACLSILGPTAAAALLAKLMATRMQTTPKACTKLLKQITTDNKERDAEASVAIIQAYRGVAAAAVQALPQLGSVQEAVQWSQRGERREIKPDPTTITDLLTALQQLKASDLMETAVTSIAADPRAFAPDSVVVPALATLSGARGVVIKSDKALLKLWQYTAGFLLARSEVPPQKPTDWVQRAEIDCSCDDCTELKLFAADPAEKTYRFRIRKDRRQHLHRMIEEHNLDMTHKTERRGSPQTLICKKTRRLHAERVKQYKNDVECLKVLVDLYGKPRRKPESVLARMHDAIRHSEA